MSKSIDFLCGLAKIQRHRKPPFWSAVLVFVLAAGVAAGQDGFFGDATEVTEVSTGSELQPNISSDGRELFFGSHRNGGKGQRDLWVATRTTTDQPFDEPVNIEAANSPGHENSPSISTDGLTLYFLSNRPGGAGGNDLYVATRSGPDEPFGSAVPLVELNTASKDGGPSISSDDLELYFDSDRAGSRDLYVAGRRTPEASPML